MPVIYCDDRGEPIGICDGASPDFSVGKVCATVRRETIARDKQALCIALRLWQALLKEPSTVATLPPERRLSSALIARPSSAPTVCQPNSRGQRYFPEEPSKLMR